jgi:hypothetical protein
MRKHIDILNPDEKLEWLYQRGWRSVERGNNMQMWRHPDTGVTYNLPVALRLAKEACKLPADFELTPSVPPPLRD